MTAFVGVKFPVPLVREVRRLARSARTSQSDVIRRATMEYVARRGVADRREAYRNASKHEPVGAVSA